MQLSRKRKDITVILVSYGRNPSDSREFKWLLIQAGSWNPRREAWVAGTCLMYRNATAGGDWFTEVLLVDRTIGDELIIAGFQVVIESPSLGNDTQGTLNVI